LFAVFLAVFAHQMRYPGWAELSSTGITFWKCPFPGRSHQPFSLRWSECGPFTVSPGQSDNAPSSVECEIPTGKYLVQNSYGDLEDLLTILNAYRKAYGTDQTP
jgi:hypothetical protein